MLLQGQAGGVPTISNKSGQNNLAAGFLNELFVTELKPVYSALNELGFVFSAFVNGVTLAATHASPLTASTGTPIIGLYNPANSGKNLVLLKTKISTTSGTPGGPLLWNFIPNPNTITSAFTQATPNLVSASAGSVARLFNNTATTGSSAGSPFRMVGGPTATAVGAGIYSTEEEHKGDLIVPPGAMLALAATAAGTTHVVSAWTEWAETPI